MEKLPFFSIILPTYNRANLLQNALSSVLNQGFSDWELIIVDDGSSDNTKVLIDQLKDKRIKYFNKGRQGKGGARNLGLEVSEGKYICFLDDDDVYYSNHLEVLYSSILTKPKYKLFRTGICFKLDKKIKNQKIAFNADKQSQLLYLWTNFFSLQNICLIKTLAKTERFSDLDLWEDKQYLQKMLFKEDYFQTDQITVQLNDGPHRSVNNAYNNPSRIENQIQAIRNSYADLQKEFPSVSKKINIKEYVAKTYLNHAISARNNNDTKVYFNLTRKIISTSKSPRIIFQLLKGIIN